jgi:hypothetical protein
MPKSLGQRTTHHVDRVTVTVTVTVTVHGMFVSPTSTKGSAIPNSLIMHTHTKAIHSVQCIPRVLGHFPQLGALIEGSSRPRHV